jgi:CxxC motif-containing protein
LSAAERRDTGSAPARGDAPRKIVCLVCPTSCRLSVRETGDEPEVVGAACERGVEYAWNELVDPLRVFTSTVRVRGGVHSVVSVRSADLVPRDLLRDLAAASCTVIAEAPVHEGDTLAEDLPGGTLLVATASVPAAR